MISWKPVDFDEQTARKILKDALERLSNIKGYEPDKLRHIKQYNYSLIEAWEDAQERIDSGFINKDMELIKTAVKDFEELSLKIFQELKGAA